MTGSLRRRRMVVILAVVAAAVAAATFALAQSNQAGVGDAYEVLLSGNGGPPVPEEGAYLGAAVSPVHYTQQSRIDTVRRFNESLGGNIMLAHVYVRWDTPLATPSTIYFANHGHDLLVSWATTDIRRIASGEEDDGIVSMARQVKALGRPIFLEPRWEMDRPNLAATVHSAEDFVAAWERIRLLFAEQAVTNVSWVWCPTAEGFADGRAAAYYPGDALVDWICADGYPDRDSYQPFADVFRSFLQWASSRSKPVMIGEFGVPKSYHAQRAEWLLDAATYVRSRPQVKALVYFNGPADPGSLGRDYRLQGDEPAMRALRTLAGNGYFIGAK